MKQFLTSVSRPLFIILVSMLLAAGLFRSGFAPVFHTTQSINNDFAVTGEGIVSMPPDQAEISLGILVTDTSVKSAQTKANAKIETVKNSLKSLNIKDEDIKTSSYSINPNYDYTSNTRNIKDYSVNITLTIKTKDLNRTGEVIDAATDGGLNTINGLNFSLSDPQKALDQARIQAVKDAKRKAEITARTAGFNLGKIVNYSEYDNSGVEPQPLSLDSSMSKQGMGGAEMSVPATQINPGSSEIKLVVTLTYQTL